MKFGGSSVATVERIERAARRVVEAKRRGDQVAVVVSAMGDTTDELIALAKRLDDRPPAREMDMLLSTGEQVSIALLAMAIRKAGEGAVSLTGGQAGIRVEAVHGKARILSIDTSRIERHWQEGLVVVVAGFQGVTDGGDIATLGRGGSDTTAVALAAALGADLCEIYTDVDGVYTADPRLVPEARKIPEISYDEMLELANLGAVVLHPRAVECAKLYGVPLVVRSSFHDGTGTWVKEEATVEQEQVVRGIAHDLNVAKVSLVGVPNRRDNLQKVFHALAQEKINVDIIVQSVVHNDVHDISFTVSRDDLPRTLEVLEAMRLSLGAGEIVAEENLAKVSIVGAGMISNPGVAARMFDALIEAGMTIRMVSTSEIKVSCVIDAADVKRAVEVLHRTFGLGGAEERSTKQTSVGA